MFRSFFAAVLFMGVARAYAPCAEGQSEMSVEGINGIYCVDQSPICVATISDGACPDVQEGLPEGSYCGLVAPDVYGCKVGKAPPVSTSEAPPVAVPDECAITCPDYDSPLCGSDNATYINLCDLTTAQCLDHELLPVAVGTCDAPVEYHDTRHPADVNSKCDIICPMFYAPWCGSDGTTYTNVCTVAVANCLNEEVYPIYLGECVPSVETPEPSSPTMEPETPTPSPTEWLAPETETPVPDTETPAPETPAPETPETPASETPMPETPEPEAPVPSGSCTDVSVEGVEGAFCVTEWPICVATINDGACPGVQEGLPRGSYCGIVAPNVYGCKVVPATEPDTPADETPAPEAECSSMSVEGVEGVFSVCGAACAADLVTGACPDAQEGLEYGSYCGIVASGVYGCKPYVQGADGKEPSGVVYEAPHVCVNNEAGDIPVSVVGTGTFCTMQPACAGTINGNCPGVQEGLEVDSVCAIISTGVHGCVVLT